MEEKNGFITPRKCLTKSLKAVCTRCRSACVFFCNKQTEWSMQDLQQERLGEEEEEERERCYLLFFCELGERPHGPLMLPCGKPMNVKQEESQHKNGQERDYSTTHRQ